MIIVFATLVLNVRAAKHERMRLDSVRVVDIDSIQSHIEGRRNPDRIIDSIESRSKRSGVYKFIYENLVVKDERNDSLINGKILDESHLYEMYDGRIIANIIFIRGKVFEGTSLDWLTRTANNIHITTREKVLRNDLLFEEGDIFNADMVIKNEQLLDSRSYTSHVSTYVMRNYDDSTRVDIYIATRDRWSISADASVSADGRTMLKLYDANLMGFGTKLSVESNFNWKRGGYGGTYFDYQHPNILGSFFSGQIKVGKNYEDSDLYISVNKDFLLPTDFGMGAAIAIEKRMYYMLYADSSINTKRNYADLWSGKSIYFKSVKSSLYFGTRYYWSNYTRRPETVKNFNPAFHTISQLLANVGISREKFYSASMVYGYGYKEYLATGYKAELLGGFSWEEFSNRWYAGAHYSMGGVTRLGHLSIKLMAGSFINDSGGSLSQSNAGFTFRYLSPLLGKGRSRVRQFGEISHIHGWNRMNGNNEVITFDPHTGLIGFRGHADGTTRTLLTSETVVFTPYKPWGFNMSIFSFGSLGFLGDSFSPLNNAMFTSFGVGVRLKNEHLIFNAVQIRLGVVIGRSGLLKNDYVSVSNQPRVTGIRFNPSRAEIISYE